MTAATERGGGGRTGPGCHEETTIGSHCSSEPSEPNGGLLGRYGCTRNLRIGCAGGGGCHESRVAESHGRTANGGLLTTAGAPRVAADCSGSCIGVGEVSHHDCGIGCRFRAPIGGLSAWGAVPEVAAADGAVVCIAGRAGCHDAAMVQNHCLATGGGLSTCGGAGKVAGDGLGASTAGGTGCHEPRTRSDHGRDPNGGLSALACAAACTT